MLIATVTESLITAGAGILGAIGGTLATGYITRNAERDRQRAEGEAAWRLLRAELRDALDAVYEIRRKGMWPIGWRRNWTAACQDARRPLLLSPPKRVSADALTTVEKACAVINQLESAVNAARPDDERPLMGRDQIFLWELQDQDLGPACAVLGVEIRGEAPPRPTPDELRSWEAEPERREGRPGD